LEQFKVKNFTFPCFYARFKFVSKINQIFNFLVSVRSTSSSPAANFPQLTSLLTGDPNLPPRLSRHQNQPDPTSNQDDNDEVHIIEEASRIVRHPPPIYQLIPVVSGFPGLQPIGYVQQQQLQRLPNLVRAPHLTANLQRPPLMAAVVQTGMVPMQPVSVPQVALVENFDIDPNEVIRVSSPLCSNLLSNLNIPRLEETLPKDVRLDFIVESVARIGSHPITVNQVQEKSSTPQLHDNLRPQMQNKNFTLTTTSLNAQDKSNTKKTAETSQKSTNVSPISRVEAHPGSISKVSVAISDKNSLKTTIHFDQVIDNVSSAQYVVPDRLLTHESRAARRQRSYERGLYEQLLRNKKVYDQVQGQMPVLPLATETQPGSVNDENAKAPTDVGKFLNQSAEIVARFLNPSVAENGCLDGSEVQKSAATVESQSKPTSDENAQDDCEIVEIESQWVPRRDSDALPVMVHYQKSSLTAGEKSTEKSQGIFYIYWIKLSTILSRFQSWIFCRTGYWRKASCI